MKNQSEMPTDKGIDHTLELLKEGYNFIINRRDSLGSNVFKTRLLGQPAICLSGSEAASLFYDTNRFQRAGPAPLPVKKTLFGEGGVQSLDDDAHKHRKALFLSMWTDDMLAELRRLTRDYFVRAAREWVHQDSIELYHQAKLVMTQVICDWSGVPLKDEEIGKRASQLSQMYEKAGHAGFSHFKGWSARSKAEDWIEAIVAAVRNGDIKPDSKTALFKFTSHRDLDGVLLDKHIVAVEILNLLRPTVANAVWIAFAALAIHDYPQQIEKIRRGSRHHLLNSARKYAVFTLFSHLPSPWYDATSSGRATLLRRVL